MARPHPADDFNAAIIANAVEWTAFIQAGGRITLRRQHEAEARVAAQYLANSHGRPALVYAINAAGRSALAATIHPRKEKAMTTEPKPMSSAEIAKLTALITGADVGRANSRNAAEHRFIRAALERGIAEPEVILTGHYALAEKAVREAMTAISEPAPVVLSEQDHAAIADASKKVADEIVRRREARRAAVDLAEASPEIVDSGCEANPLVAHETSNVNDKPNDPIRPAGGKRAAALEAAQRGDLPVPPDFSANTHKPYRVKLAKLIALVEQGDIEGLKAFPINPVSSSPKAMDKFRNLAVIALEARQQIAA